MVLVRFIWYLYSIYMVFLWCLYGVCPVMKHAHMRVWTHSIQILPKVSISHQIKTHDSMDSPRSPWSFQINPYKSRSDISHHITPSKTIQQFHIIYIYIYIIYIIYIIYRTTSLKPTYPYPKYNPLKKKRIRNYIKTPYIRNKNIQNPIKTIQTPYKHHINSI